MVFWAQFRLSATAIFYVGLIIIIYGVDMSLMSKCIILAALGIKSTLCIVWLLSDLRECSHCGMVSPHNHEADKT